MLPYGLYDARSIRAHLIAMLMSHNRWVYINDYVAPISVKIALYWPHPACGLVIGGSLEVISFKLFDDPFRHSPGSTPTGILRSHFYRVCSRITSQVVGILNYK